MSLRLNLGCGDNRLPDWVNIDLAQSADISMDLRQGLPFSSNSCEAIAAIHVLEHFTLSEAEQLLTECYRVLNRGGILRLGVPDLHIFARAYVEQDTNFYSWPGPHDGLRFAGETLADRFMFVVLGEGHCYCYDYDSLRHLLRNVGFKIIERCEYKVGNIPDVHSLDNRPEVSLFVEAVKTQASPIPVEELRRIHRLKRLIALRRFRYKCQRVYSRLRAAIGIRHRVRVALCYLGIIKPSPPSTESIARQNTPEVYNEIYGTDAHLQFYLGAERLTFYQRVANLCVVDKPRLILDVGCGSGDFLRIINLRLLIDDVAAKLYGLDLSKNGIIRAKERLPSGMFVIGSGHHLGYVSDFFDLVVAMEVLEHVLQPMEMVKELVRVCKPGGKIVITVPDGEYDTWPGHINYWTQDKLQDMLHGIGLQEISRIPENNVLVAVLVKPY
jgi:predicted SAM-dependent methyltransferase